jgi:hypothetical protein
MADPREEEELFADVARRGAEIYEMLKDALEAEHTGKAVAIHVDSGDYAIADSFPAARAEMHRRRPEGLLFSTRIGPPTDSDIRLGHRILAGKGIEPYASIYAAGKRRQEEEP